MKKLAILLIVLTSIWIHPKAQSLSELMSSPFPTDLVASSKINMAAWVENAEGVRNIWLASGNNLKSQQLTDYTEDDGQGISNLIISPDGKYIYFVRGAGANRRGEIPNPNSMVEMPDQAIHRLEISTKEIRKISKGSSPTLSSDGKHLAFTKGGQVWHLATEDSTAKQMFRMRGGASNLSWSPDTEQPTMLFTSNRGTHSLVGTFTLGEDRIQWMRPNVDRNTSPVWSPDGSQVAYMQFWLETDQWPFFERRKGLPWSIWVGNPENGSVKMLWQAEEGAGSVFRGISAAQQLMWTSDDQLVFPWEKEGWTHLYSIPASGGKAICLTPGEFEVQFVALNSDKTEVLYSSNQDDIDRQHVWKVAAKGGKPELLTAGKGVEWSPVQIGPNGPIAFLASNGTAPAQAMVMKRNKPAALGRSFNYPSDKLVEPEQVIFSGADGMQIHGQLFLPKNITAGEKRPAVIFFHGGSRRQMLLGFHHRGYYHNAYTLNQYLASKGYVVLSVNYRSGIGYGMEFREAINYGANGASEYNDVIGAGLYLQQRADVDPKRIGLWGGSYGGYLTALGLSRASDLFAAGVDIHGVHDWNEVIEGFRPDYNRLANPERTSIALESSPMSSIHTWKSPVLLIHGDDDRNVPFSESVMLAEALRKQGVHFEQLIFPDEVHGFLLHRNWMAAFEATVDFFDRWLRR